MRGVCASGPDEGLVLVRSMWRAEVELAPWEPGFEITHRRLVPANRLVDELGVAALPFAPVNARMIHEAGVYLGT